MHLPHSLLWLAIFLLPTFRARPTKPDVNPILKQIAEKAKKSKEEHLTELFNLFCNLKKKHYKSPNEFNFRRKIFRENLNQFIMKGDDVLDRIKIEHDKKGSVRLLIRPDKRLSVDFNVDEEQEEEPVQFELNQFSDLSQKEFDNLFLLDQSFFDESKYPAKFDDSGFSGIQNIRKYIKKLEARGVEVVEEIKELYKELPKSEDKELRFTPHFSTLMDSEEEDAFFSESEQNFSLAEDHSTLLSKEHPRMLQGFRRYWGRGPRRWNSNRSSFDYRRFRDSPSNPINRESSYAPSMPSGRFIPDGQQTISIDGVEVPTYLNWREMNGVSPIKNQHKCNACYAFAGVGALECHYKIKTGQTVSLSEQEIVDCSRENNRCVGGLPHLTFDYIRRESISFERDYSYDRQRYASCRRSYGGSKFSGSNLRGYTNLRRGMLNLIKALSDGPVAVISYASFPFKHYRGGIFRGQGCYGQTKPNHASVLIGYKLTGKQKYLYFKNGWGTNWGESGYYKVQLGEMNNRSKGHCMIAATNYNSIPRV